jgi:hypothetical protein
MLNSGELKGVMAKNHDTQEKLAEALDLQVSGLNARINGKIEFRRSEINAIRHRYHLSPQETITIFFDDEVSQ